MTNFGSQDDHVHADILILAESDSGQGTHSSFDLPLGKPGNGNKLLQISDQAITDNKNPWAS